MDSDMASDELGNPALPGDANDESLLMTGQ
jgi:hypothetical protein